MAIRLRLFERVESGKSLFAVEAVSLIYNALTTILILMLYGRMDHPGTMLLERLGIVVLTFTLIWLYQAFPCRLTAFIRMVVQMALLIYWYPDTFEFNRLFPNMDHFFAATEQDLFNCQPSVEFSKMCPSMWFSEPFNLGYFSYYPMMLVVVLFYFFKNFQWFERVCFVLIASFFIYYFVYILLPVAGPQFYFPAIGMDKVNAGIFPAIGDYFNTNYYLVPEMGDKDGFFYGLVEMSQEIGERPTAAFPSSHVGISTIVMLLAWRESRKLTFILLPFYILLCCATVYIQAHYLIDSIAGFITAFFVFHISMAMYDKWFMTSAFKNKEVFPK